MPTPCRVCSHLARPEIDARLVQHAVNISQLSREYGVPRKSLIAHRDRHLPTFLKVYGAAVDLPTLGELHTEALRVYMATLDELGRAQAGVLIDVGDDGKEHRAISHTAIARLLDGARKSVDQLARLAADGATESERPTGVADAELTARLRTQLERVVARADRQQRATVGDEQAAIEAAEVIAEVSTAHPQAVGTPEAPAGGQTGSSPHTSSSSIPLDAATLPETLSESTRRAIEEHERRLEGLPPAYEDSPVVLTIPNPHFPGSQAASPEERKAAGFPDIEITLDDLRSRPDLLAQIANPSTPSTSSPEA